LKPSRSTGNASSSAPLAKLEPEAIAQKLGTGAVEDVLGIGGVEDGVLVLGRANTTAAGSTSVTLAP
jgi:hypothetical protein